jgi:sulfur-oxidizing protein SoxB
MTRREFVHVLAAAVAAGGAIDSQRAEAAATALYDPPRFGNVSLLHISDTHAQLRPVYYREPSVNLGLGPAANRPPHLVGERLLRYFGVAPGTREAHALTHLDFAHAAVTYGRVGGFAHLATLVKRLRASRPGALLLDAGDTWQGSATALWTRGQDMVDAARALGVDVMTGHWEFTYGADRVREIVERELKGHVDFVAHNVKTLDFGDTVFPPYALREVNGVAVAVIGQAFPYTPIANPRDLVPEWTFGIQEANLQMVVDEARGRGARTVVLLSHNGTDVDVKLASRVRGLDAIMGGHTHDGLVRPLVVDNGGHRTLITNAGASGKFLALLDLDVRGTGVAGYRYRLLPVFANLIPADAEMDALIARLRAPWEARLAEPLAVTEGLLYRRGNFSGTWDQLLVEALMTVKGAEVALSPGFRWGSTLLPGQTITLEDVMSQTAITYPQTTLTDMTGQALKRVLEDVGDNLFNPDPYYQQGGDMVRTGGLTYTCEPMARAGHRISNLRIGGTPISASHMYRVASWAPVSQEARAAGGEAMWDVVARYLRDRRTVRPLQPNVPVLRGIAGNAGLAR